MSNSTNQHLILIEGMATYERILSDLLEVELDERIRHLNDFLKIYPDLARAHNDLAVMYYQAENSLKALAHFEKAHKLDPANIIYRKNLADFYFVELEWTGDAINNYLEILKEHPNDIDSLNALGTISLKIGRKEQARQYFSRTLQIENNNHEAMLAIQQLPEPTNESTSSLHQLHHKLSAPTCTAETTPPPAKQTAPRTSFQNLFNTTPQPPVKSSEELYRTAMTLVNADKTEDAIKSLETLIVQDSNHALAHNDLGVLYQMRGNLQESLEQHRVAVRLQPENSTFQRNLADLLCNGFGEFEAALTIYVKLFGENSYDVETIKAIAHICIETGKFEDALFFLEKGMEIKPWDQDIAETIRTLKAAL